MKKKILIIGGTGFIGFHLAQVAKKKNFDTVIISTRKPKKIRKLQNVKYIICDITNKKKLEFILKNMNFDFVVNLGGYVDHTNKTKTFQSHYNGCKNIANIFLNKKIKSFVQIGSGGEYGNLKSPHKETNICRPQSNYSKAKYQSTKFLISLFKKKNFPSTIVRLYQVYGPRQDANRFLSTIIKKCLNNKKFPSSEGIQYRDFTYIDDVIRSIFLIFKEKKSRGKIFNIGFGAPIKIRNIVYKIIKKCKGGKPIFGEIKLRKEENLMTYPNIAKAKLILNWKPKISFDKGILRTIRYYEKN